jgi:hypothetical protein
VDRKKEATISRALQPSTGHRRSLGQEDSAMTDESTKLDADDFPIETDRQTLKTHEGEPIAQAKSKKLADEIAQRLNEQAYREQEDCWSA